MYLGQELRMRNVELKMQEKEQPCAFSEPPHNTSYWSWQSALTRLCVRYLEYSHLYEVAP